ncbi:SCY kinase-related protein (incomplete catalytic triad) [Cardiosporidium cionae]|uniref:SCY kinase-related protein (Incomplete catalytic triad) n=1 Tax=Cardiosporidium cionae TaxID=476202 RepID=A0ABQ7J618_9APIC|nr:SCY kinase-related protein (incomplete catalytic triad) [Cardiosporidium cionae]|eukprot:KAF8819426.1 SCY kinase-related protein (incomplete catalytic triad) [Cardiosporidium cionae]
MILATSKERPSESVTIFAFDKTLLNPPIISSYDSERILQFLRKDATTLSKLRHPHILSVVDPLSEERNSLAFATKPVLSTLEMFIQSQKDVPLSLLEIKSGIFDILEALNFLHTEAKIAHLAISPETIFVTEKRKWLLGGMGSSISIPSIEAMKSCPFSLEEIMKSSLSIGKLSPYLLFSPPEFSSKISPLCGAPSDIFEIGLLMNSLWTGETSSSNKNSLKSSTFSFVDGLHREDSSYAKFQNSQVNISSFLPEDIRRWLLPLLSSNPSHRPTAEIALHSPIFQNVNLRALRFLEHFPEKEESERKQFLERFLFLVKDNVEYQNISLLQHRVIPHLLECLKQALYFPVVLPIIFYILHYINDSNFFRESTWPYLKPLFTAEQIQKESVVILVNEIKFFLEFLDEENIKHHILPFAMKCIKLKEITVQEAALKAFPFVAMKFEYSRLRNIILPRLSKLILSADSTTLRVCCIEAIMAISSSVDKASILEHVIPSLEHVIQRDSSPLMCTSFCQALKRLSEQLGSNVSARFILPLLIPLLVVDDLPLTEYEYVLNTIKSILNKIEQEKKQSQKVAFEKTESVKKAFSLPEKREMKEMDSLEGIFTTLNDCMFSYWVRPPPSLPRNDSEVFLPFASATKMESSTTSLSFQPSFESFSLQTSLSSSSSFPLSHIQKQTSPPSYSNSSYISSSTFSNTKKKTENTSKDPFADLVGG